MPQFAVIHVQRGTPGGVTGLQKHINREIDVPNANKGKAKLNYFYRPDLRNHICSTPHDKPLYQRINERIAEGYTGKVAIRKDAVKNINIILSGSHDTMYDLFYNGGEKFDDWVEQNYRFIASRFGAKNIVEFAVHADETTPHIHCVVVPLTPDGRLSAKEMLGNKSKMRELQDEYAERMSWFGLKRGVRKTKAHHTEIRKWYAQDHDKELAAARARITELERRLNIDRAQEKGREKIPPSKKDLFFGI